MNKHIAFAFAGAALLAVPSFAEDQGAAIAAAAQDGSAAVSVPAENFVSAEDKVKEQLAALGLNPEGGYDRKRKAIIAIGTAYLTTKKSPAGDDGFMIKRGLKATEAYLRAKADIIQAIYTEVKAEDRLNLPAEALSEEGQKLKEQSDIVKDKLVGFAEKAGNPELADAEVNDDLIATLKGLEFPAVQQPNPDDPDGEPMSSPNPLSAERDSLVAEIQSIVKAAKALPATPDQEIDNNVKLFSKMPLLGAKILTQAESWDKTENLYQMSMAVIWSPKLQEEAKNLAMGKPTTSEKKGKLSVQEWIQRQDLLSMVGPWSFTDNEGKTIIIGIAARDVSGIPATKIAKARTGAETSARASVATSLLCDLQTFTETSTHMAEYDDGSSDADEKVAQEITSKTQMALSGALKLASKEGFHPITGRKVYAVAFYLEPDLSEQAMERMKQLYADATSVTDASKFKEGQHAGMEATYEEAKASDQKFEEGKAEAAADVSSRVRAAEVKAKVSGPQGSSGKNQVGETGGVVSGVDLDTVDLDF